MRLQRLRLTLLLILAFLASTQDSNLPIQQEDEDVLPVGTEEASAENIPNKNVKRILQNQNSKNPTGPNMFTHIIYPNDIQTLTPEMLNQIARQNGQDISGNNQLLNSSTNSSVRNSTTPIKTNNSNNRFPQVKNQTKQNSSVRVNVAQPINTTNSPVTKPTEPRILAPQTNSTSPFRIGTIEDLLRYSSFNSALRYAKTLVEGYSNQNQLLQAMFQSIGPNSTNYRLTIRTQSGVTQIDISIYGSGSVFIPPKKYPLVNKVDPQLNSLGFMLVDRVIKANYPSLVANSTIQSVTQQSIPLLNSTIFTIKYQKNLSLTEFTVQLLEGSFSVVKILNIKPSSAILNQTFNTVDLWGAMQTADYNLASTDAIIRKFINQTYPSPNRKNFVLVSILSSLSPAGDIITYYFRYLVDNVTLEVGARFNIVTRRQTIEYLKNRQNPSTLKFPPKAGFVEQNYTSFANNQAFRNVDRSMRSKYPSQLGNSVITQVDTGRLPDNRSAIHIIYLGNGKYYEINSP